jgi:hypothetical protein
MGGTKPSWVAQAEGKRRPWILTLVLAAVILAIGGWFGFKELRSTLALEAPGKLALRPGEVKSVRLQVRRHRLEQPVRLTWTGLPDHCEAPEITLAGDENSVDVPVVIAPDAAPGTKTVTVRATSDGADAESAIELSIEAPPMYTLPSGWAKAKGATVKSVEGRAYYDKIDVVRDGIAVRFLLMAKTGKNDPDTFYIMEDKVWNGLYRKFAEHVAAEKPALTTRWEKEIPTGVEKPGEYPVLGVYAVDADRCAEWLGGKLPLPSQWDKAAGYYGEKKGEGPYDPSFDPKKDEKRLEIALGRSTPLPRGQAKKDVSPLGCHDMAGNGKEWTGANDKDWQRTPPTRSSREGLSGFVNVRGRHYAELDPYSWEDIATGGAPLPGKPGEGEPPVGFRVVLEP